MIILPVIQYASHTDVGMRRAANQDALVVKLSTEFSDWGQCGHLFTVADGMGGHSVGDLASRITVESLPLAYFKQEAETVAERLQNAIVAANRAINDKARENPEFADMGTTCSSLVLTPNGAWIGHVGDSRIYRVRAGKVEQLTFDHSLQWEMVRQGKATIDNVDMLHPRNVITRCLGPDQNVEIDIEGPFHVLPGDHFVLCSDGLTGHLSDNEIGAIAGSLPPADAARLLVNLANCRGGTDNVTVVVARVEKYPRLSGEFVDLNPPATAKKRQGNRKWVSTLFLGLFLLFGSIGLVLLAFGKTQPGLLTICPALILGFIRFIIVTSGKADDFPGEQTTASQPNSPGMPALKTPYRSASANIEPAFMEFLREAQSELTQAGQDNGWMLDMDELGEINRQALLAFRHKKMEQCIRFRAQAIDELMKELYAHTRRN